MFLMKWKCLFDLLMKWIFEGMVMVMVLVCCWVIVRKVCGVLGKVSKVVLCSMCCIVCFGVEL